MPSAHSFVFRRAAIVSLRRGSWLWNPERELCAKLIDTDEARFTQSTCYASGRKYAEERTLLCVERHLTTKKLDPG